MTTSHAIRSVGSGLSFRGHLVREQRPAPEPRPAPAAVHIDREWHDRLITASIAGLKQFKAALNDGPSKS